MPDPQYPSNWQPYQSPVQYPTGYQPYTPPPPPIQEPGVSWMPKVEDFFTWPNAVRMGLSTAGDVIGGLAGLGSFGSLYAPISFAGGALGELGGQLLEGKSPNWGLIGTEGVLNLAPGPNLPGRGAGLGQLAKYGLKAGGYGAEQAALGAFPRYWAEQGTLTSPSKWEPPPIDSLIGQTIAGAGIGTAVGGGLAAGRRGLELLGRSPTPTTSTSAESILGQATLPGMENVDFGAKIPETTYENPAATTPEMQQRRAHAAIDARTQQTLFELSLDLAEAQRAGDGTRITQINDAMLEARLRSAEQKRNWQPEPTQSSMFPDMGGEQGDLSGFTWRQGGKFTRPENISPEMRQGVLGPETGMWPGRPVTIEDMAPAQGVAPESPAVETVGLPQVIDLPTTNAEMALRKNQGYVTHPTLKNPVSGVMQMTLGGAPPPAPAIAAVTTPPSTAGAARKVPGKIKFGEDISVPTEIVNADPSYITNMEGNGYRVVSNEGGVTLFRHESKTGTRMGTMDIGEMINLLRRGLGQIADSHMASKVRSAITDLNRRLQNGETQILDSEFRSISAIVPNIEQLSQEMGIDLPSVRAQFNYGTHLDTIADRARLDEQHGIPVRRIEEPTQSGHQEQLIRNAQTVEELDRLVDQFGDDYDVASLQNDPAAMNRAYDLNRAVATRRIELTQTPLRGEHANWLEGNDPDGLRQIESATDYQQLRTQVHEWERQRVAANAAGDRVNGHRLYRMVMAGYDRLNDLRTTDPNWNPAPARRSAESQAATQPVEASGWQEAAPDNLPPMHPNQVSLYELADRMNITSRPSELNAIRVDVEAALEDAIQDNFYPGIAYARRLLENIDRKLGEPVQESFNLESQPVPTPPIQYGPQAQMKGNLKLDTPTYDRLAQIVEGRAALTKQEKKKLMASDSWQDYGIRTAQAAGHGPPGLSVEKIYGGRDRVVYRNPAGEPIVSAEVRTNPDGTREVPSLGADKTRLPVPPGAKPGTIGTFVHGALLARGMHQVGMKLVEMGAAFTSGSTSAFTKNLVHSIMKRVSNGVDESSAELASLIRQLMKVKQVEGTLPRRIRTPEDVAQFIADISTDESMQPELPFEPRARVREKTAAELENLPEQQGLDFAGGEQMPLPLESAINPTIRNIIERIDRESSPGGDLGVFDRNMEEFNTQYKKMNPDGLRSTLQIIRDKIASIKKAGGVLEDVEVLTRMERLITGRLHNLGAPQTAPLRIVSNTTAKRWSGLVKQLDEMKAPDETYRQIIASENTPPLKSGETWRQRVLSAIEFFEMKARKAIERIGGDDDTGSLNIAGIGDSIRDTIHGFFARGPKTKAYPKGEPSTFEQMIGLPTAATTIADLSMPLRQGLAAIMTPEWRAALKPMFKSFFSGEFAKIMDEQIRNNKVHQKEFNPTTGKWEPSYAERANMKLVEGSQLSASENEVASTWIETGGNLGGVSKFYENTYGRLAKASNRSAATFLNHLRTGLLERLSDQAQLMAQGAEASGSARPNLIKQKFTPEQAANLNPYYNDNLAKTLGDYINTVTGRAPLKLDIIPGAPQLNLEFMAKAMGYVFFSPRNMFSRARMMSPATYMMAPAFVRKQYLKSAFATVAAWGTMTYAAKMGAEAFGYETEVSFDPESADFGKLRIGKTRLDLGGGFLPFAVAATRLWTGFFSSSSTNKRHAYGQEFRAETQESQLQRFFSNKFNPASKFGYDLLKASKYTPFHVADRTAQMFVPLVAQDTIEMFKEDPKLIPLLMPPVMLGAGTQIYGRSEQVAKLVPKKYDWVVKGGGLKDILYPPDWMIFGGK